MAVPDPPAGERPEGPPSTLPATLAARIEEIVRAAEREAAVMQRDLEAHRRSAEDEARRYMDEARREAEALVRRRVQRMRELTDELVERAQDTSRHFDDLIAALERATTRLADEDLAVAPVGDPPPRPARRPLSSQPSSEESAEAPGGAPPPPAALRAAIRRPEDLIDPPSARSEQEPPARLQRPVHRTRRTRGGGTSAGDRGTGLPGDAAESVESAAALEAARLVAIEMAVAGRTRAEVDAHLRDSFRIDDTADLLDDVFGGGSGEATRSSWGSP